jgi:hypothetical protein
VLVERHIGAVLIGLVLSEGVTILAATLVSPIANAFMRSRQRLGVFDSAPPIFSPSELIIGFSRAAVVIVIGLLLLKWLYLPKKELVMEEEAEREQA